MSTAKLATEQIFSQRLHEARRTAGLKSKDLALKAGISSAYLSQLENGKRGNPSSELANKLAEELSVHVDWLIGRSEEIAQSVNLPCMSNLTDKGEIELRGAGETVHLRGMMYGAVPPYYDVPYQPQWNVNLGRMTDDEIIANVRDGVEWIKNKPRGPDRAHTCHYLMDFLNELACRKEKKG